MITTPFVWCRGDWAEALILDLFAYTCPDGDTYAAFAATARQSFIFFSHFIPLSVTAGDGVFFSIYDDRVGNELHFVITPPGGTTSAFGVDAHGADYTLAAAMDNWSGSTPATPAQPSANFRLGQGGAMGSSIRLPGIVAAVAFAGAAVLAAAPAAQAVADSPAAVTVPCSTDALVSAIDTANSGSGGTLLLPRGCIYNITTPATSHDGLPIITEPIALVSGGGTVIGRSAAASTAFRVFEVASGGTLSLTGITVRNGSIVGLGGGILNAGTVHLTGVVLSGNRANNGGGLSNSSGATADIYNASFQGNTTTSVGGGGIINFGTLTVNGGLISGNTAPINGGGLNTQASGISHLVQTRFVHNTSGSLGGAIANLGTTTLNGTVVEMNTGSSGGIATGNDHVTLQDSYVSNNTPDNCSPLNTIPGCVD